MANLPDIVEWSEGIYLLEKSDPASGGPEINPLTKQGILNLPHLQLANRTRYLRQRVDDLARAEDVSVTVGATGDFPTLSAAMAELSRIRFGYAAGGRFGQITLKSGFELAEQIAVLGINMGATEILSEDPVVPIVRSAIDQLQYYGSYQAFTAGEGGVLPAIRCHFEFDTSPSGVVPHGCRVTGAGSSAVFYDGGGISKAPGQNLRATSTGRIFSSLGDFTGAGINGASATNGGQLALISCNCRRGESDSSSDIHVGGGGIITATSSVGGTSITPNTITSSGIIFK